MPVPKSRSGFQAGVERAPPLYSFKRMRKQRIGKKEEKGRIRRNNFCVCR
jgi:hypothetical protein